jgi:hypothetical protein
MVVYLGLAGPLKQALVTCTEIGGQGNPIFETVHAIAVMLEKHKGGTTERVAWSWGGLAGGLQGDGTNRTKGTQRRGARSLMMLRRVMNFER